MRENIAKLVVVKHPTAKWYIRLRLFFTFFRILPKWIDDTATAKKYLHAKLKNPPVGVYVDLKEIKKLNYE